MHATRSSLWRLLAALLLLVTVPAAATLPPPGHANSPAAFVPAVLPDVADDLVVVAVCYPHRGPPDLAETRVRASDLARDAQALAAQWFRCEIAVGNSVDRYDYEAFGKLVERAGTDPQPYLFAGESLDPNIRVVLQPRTVDGPRRGAVRKCRCIDGFGRNPESLHKYLYAELEPVRATDPSGFSSLIEIGAAMRIASMNVARAAVKGAAHLWKARAVRNAVSAGTFTWEVLDMAQTIVRAVHGDLFAAMEIAMELSLGKLDLVLSATTKAGKLLRLELKSVNFDNWAWMKHYRPDLLEKRIQELVDQAGRFVRDPQGAGVKHLIKHIPGSATGREILQEVTNRLRAAGVEDIAVV